ncbi:MAG: hypothetical protein FWF87_09135, partial [Synergistaceae bacterium]|nr:hypothetical protein [Synergistaceae bacterium]
MTVQRIFNNNNNIRLLLLMLCSALVGILGWSCAERFTPLLALIPILWSKAKTRKEAFLVIFAYYLAASRGIVLGAYVFFQDGSISRALLLWITSSAALSIPWLMKIQNNDGVVAVFLKVACVSLASVPPPLGIIGWANPLLVSGVFFPAWGLWGMLAMMIVWGCCIKYTKVQNLFIVTVSLLILFPVSLENKGHPDFVGVNTSFGQLASGSANLDFISEYRRIQTVFADLEERKLRGELDAKNIVLPETICVLLLTETARKEWELGALHILGADWEECGRSFFVGAEVMTDLNSKKYDNVMVSFGANTICYRQKIPVPFSMYRPFSVEGANEYLFEAEAIQLIDGTNAGFIICYEQFLTWPWLLMLIGNNWSTPSVVVCTANNLWCKDT